MKYIINFENYTNEELWQILKLKLKGLQRHFRDEDRCQKLAKAWFSLLPRTADFGNARVSKQLFDKIGENRRKRFNAFNITDIESKKEYTPEDFPQEAHDALANMNMDSLQKTVINQDGNAGYQGQQVVEIGKTSSVHIDLSSEDVNRRAVCVEHLEYSVGLLTASGGVNPEAQTGTAFVISLTNLYILTCSHVVEGKTQFTFSINELKFETPAKLVWNDSQCDLALLQVGMLPEQARYLALHHEKQPVGKTTKITLAGYPWGEQVSHNLMVNSGEITNYEAEKLNNDRCFDTYMSDINATHGNSGGPVVRQSDYQVIGLLQGGFEQVQVRLITDIRQLYKKTEIIDN